MLSKEEIEYIEQIEKALENNENFYWQEDMYELIEIIRKQHGREQKLIEKLEEANKLDKQTVQAYENMYRNATEEFYKRSYKRTIDMANARRETRKSILEIVKGVENENNKI